MTATVAVVLSGKGGSNKTTVMNLVGGEASRAGLRTLIVDIDPERNMSNHFGISAHSSGLGSVFEDAGVHTGGGDAELGAKRVFDEIRPTGWEHVDLLPAGASLSGIGQIAIEDMWLLSDIFTAADLAQKYELILIDTGGRTGSLVTQAMYAADVAFAPIGPSRDSLIKAREARVRVEKIQRAKQLRWAGIFMSNFTTTRAVDLALSSTAYETFGDQIRAEVPSRAAVSEAFTFGERLGDRRDAVSRNLARVFAQFLYRDILQRPLDGTPDGVLK